MTLIVAGFVLILVGVAFAIKKYGGEKAEASGPFKITVSGQSWLILVALGAGLLVVEFLRPAANDDEKAPPASVITGAPDPAEFVEEEGPGNEPYTFGDDEALDILWNDCGAGFMQSCDDLYQLSPVNSDYEYFGGTCGLIAVESPPAFCTDLEPPPLPPVP